MTLSLPRIAEMAAALDTLLANGKLQEMRQPEPESFLVSFRVPGETYTLFINASPGAARLHLTQKKWPNSPTPPGFLQRCRKELRGVRVISVVAADAAIEIGLEGPGDDEVRRYSLLLDIHPQRPNALLLDGTRVVLARLGPAPCPPHAKVGVEYNHHSTGQSLPTQDDYQASDPQALSREIEEHYQDFELLRRRAAEQKHYRKQLKQKLKRETKKALKIQSDFDRAEGADTLQRRGELLKAHQHALTRGMPEVEVPDYFSEGTPNIILPLNPRMNGAENVRYLFHQARRLKDARIRISKRLQTVKAQVEQLEKLVDLGQSLSNDSEREAWIQALHSAGIGPPKPRGSKERHVAQAPYRTFQANNGDEILVGRNAVHNDTLTFKVARGDDLWLHARGRKGAHVILRVAKGKEPAQESVEDASQLAAYHAEGGKTDSSVEVWIVPRKHVRKVRNGAAGAVTVSKGKTRLIRPSKERLDRLLNRT